MPRHLAETNEGTPERNLFLLSIANMHRRYCLPTLEDYNTHTFLVKYLRLPRTRYQ